MTLDAQAPDLTSLEPVATFCGNCDCGCPQLFVDPSASEDRIADGAAKSSVQHQGHGTQTGSGASAAPKADAGAAAGPEVKGVDGTTGQAPNTELAETGSSSTPCIAVAGAAVLSIGATAVITAGRRRARAAGR
ncbi:LAETG motif-containing sortase-dependent surface protein [Streptomyces sanglieri]|uniref:LAETG motif-containing sortase-dependent surface protein n=1 Tax=Streptomyces sanglieri TaxID=193460 RepID=A0ABW2XB25_9ACTN